MMNPSRHQLPQKVSADRQRGRAATRGYEQKRFTFVRDEHPDTQADGLAPLPPFALNVPGDVDFPTWQKAELVLAKAVMTARKRAVSAVTRFRNFSSEHDYNALYRMMGGRASEVGRARSEMSFARQRVAGVNPMHIRKLRDNTRTPLWNAAAEVLSHTAKLDLADLFREGKIYELAYPELGHDGIQSEVSKAPQRRQMSVRLATPSCLLWENKGQLTTLAIQLKPTSVLDRNPVFTPLHKPGDWQMARAHVACADAHLHEGVYHLLETHLVNEAVALCVFRQLHPDHPLRQLLAPHYQGTLAINAVARGNLLSPDGPIQRSMAAGVRGTMNTARHAYKTWNFSERSLHRDLESRGLFSLEKYDYRDDALRLHEALHRYVTNFLGLWYRDDNHVQEDYELRAFVDEAGSPSGGAIPGFPQSSAGENVETRIDTRQKLFALVTDLIFRTGPQHAAVNNGQFDSYGEVSAAPGRLFGEFPDALSREKEFFRESDFWSHLPDRDTALTQSGMVAVLSLPTRRALLTIGEFPDFNPALSVEATETIAALRRRLQSISREIQARNEKSDFPYRYLDPQYVSLSTDL